MSAVQEAKAMFQKAGLSTFERDLCWYLEHGIVISRPDRFLMAKLINTVVGDDDWHPKEPDAWYVHCAVGKGCLEWFLCQSPVRMPKLAWRRFKDGHNSLKVYNTNQFERFC